MSYRGTLFLLFLYLLLVWIVSLLFVRGRGWETAIEYALFASAAGVGGLLVWLLGQRVWGWRRLRRAQARTAPAAAPASRVVNEEESALATLIAEADDRLAKAAGGARRSVREHPVYLVVGPTGAGKTALIARSGIDAELLAGGVSGPGAQIASTRVANIWLINRCIFIEIGGRLFESDPQRFADAVKVLRPPDRPWAWTRFLARETAPDAVVRGVLLCQDLQGFTSVAESSRLEEASRATREHLLSIADLFGTRVPVYAVFTRADSVPYFADFFGALAAAESDQPFGVLADPAPPEEATEGQVWTESETRRLSADFNELFLSLSSRRLPALSHESTAWKKPQIYEFPREFKRLRTAVVQFLVDGFRPDRLRLNPILRGFFFTGTLPVEQHVQAGLEQTQPAIRMERSPAEATVIFREDATVVFSPGSGTGVRGDRGQLVDKWVFTKDLFQQVLQKDRPALTVVRAADARAHRQRALVEMGLGAAGLLLAILWALSWIGNLGLVSDVRRDFLAAGAARGQGLTVEALQAVEGLRRMLVERLDRPGPWRLNWGLYVGERLREAVRSAYFSRLRLLVLDPANGQIVSRLRRTDPGQRYEAMHNRLQAHLTIAGRGCEVEAPVVAAVLREAVAEVHPGLDETRRALVDRQIDYYLEALRKSDPAPLAKDQEAIAAGRAWLHNARGLEQTYHALITQVRAGSAVLYLKDKIGEYRQVLTAPEEVAFEFTREGKQKFESLADSGKFGVAGKPCVVGALQSAEATVMDAEHVRQVKALYYRADIEAWKQFLARSGVKRFSSPEDAAAKLDVLTGPGTPLLGLIRFAGENTFVPTAKTAEAATSIFDRIAPGAAKAKQQAGKLAEKAGVLEPVEVSAARLSQVFQPAHYASQPETPKLVTESNKGYVEKLRGAQQALERYARASREERPALIQPAQDALGEAGNAARSLADGFNKNTDGVDALVADLLMQPVRLARAVIPASPDKAVAADMEGKLRAFCASSTFSKYPFSRGLNAADASMEEVGRLFSPATGLLAQPWLSAIAVRNGARWEARPDAKVRPSKELVELLNRAQEFAGLFPPGAQQPQVEYDLRPTAGQKIKIRLEIDGSTMASSLQQRFAWPARSGARQGAGLWANDIGVDQASGYWGVFKVFSSAEPRAMGAKEVVWTKSGRGEVQLLLTPVRVEFVSFPGGVDLFNPKFFEGLRCPARLVER
jgi:type VI secretion system protein ImpL